MHSILVSYVGQNMGKTEEGNLHCRISSMPESNVVFIQSYYKST